MKHALWAVLLGVAVVVGCGREPQRAVLDIAPGSSVTVESPNVADQVVKVSGRSVVFVIQNKRVTFTLQWPRADSGEVTVPLTKVDDGSGARMHIGIMRGLMPAKLGEDLCDALCPNCAQPVECCP